MVLVQMLTTKFKTVDVAVTEPCTGPFTCAALSHSVHVIYRALLRCCGHIHFAIAYEVFRTFEGGL